jgi:hypothetical protein
MTVHRRNLKSLPILVVCLWTVFGCGLDMKVVPPSANPAQTVPPQPTILATSQN